MTREEIIARFEKYDFRDPQGHPPGELPRLPDADRPGLERCRTDQEPRKSAVREAQARAVL